MIDKQTDVFEQLINSLDFTEQNVSNRMLFRVSVVGE